MVRRSARHFYQSMMRQLVVARVPFLVGGAFALKHYAGIARGTKDLDVFVRATDLDRAIGVLSAHGCATEVTFPHWLAKAYSTDPKVDRDDSCPFVDIIFNSANGLCPVDDEWFEHAVECSLFGMPVDLCPVEEVIWTKSFIMERERFDGADICHLLEAQGQNVDWPRLLRRYGENWRVLLGHLVFYTFVYPGRRDQVPAEILEGLLSRARDERDEVDDVRVCRGTLVSREQYLVDLRERGLRDARLPPWGHLSRENLAIWTEAIERRPGCEPDPVSKTRAVAPRRTS